MFPARVAVSAQVLLAFNTDTVVPLTEQPVDAPVLKLYKPEPSPPEAAAVPVVPYVTEPGAVTVTGTLVGFIEHDRFRSVAHWPA